MAIGLWAIAVMPMVGCQKNGKDLHALRPVSAGVLNLTCADTLSVPKNTNGVVTISTLTNDKIWKLNGVNYIAAGQTLTIQPGTRLVTGSKQTYNDPTHGPQSMAGIIVVGRGGNLIADGKAPHPDSTIVFTTLKQLGICEPGCDVAGSGPGIVMVGSAQTNRTTTTFVEGLPMPLGLEFSYGFGYTVNNADNSGVLRYVRIEFPGYILDQDNEINGLTLAGVGTGTIISHVQVSYSKDDAFQFFGGTVNCDHLVALAPEDDGLDFQQGYTGTIASAIVLEDPCTNHARSGIAPAVSDANGIEAANDAIGSTALPVTRPVLRHITVLGYASSSGNPGHPGNLLNGARFRRNAIADMQYSIVAGFPTGVRFDAPTLPAGICNSVVLGYSIVWNIPPACTNNFTRSTSPADNYLQLGNAANPFFSCAVAGTYNTDYLIPDIGSPADGTSIDYKGAFDPNTNERWTTGWAKFNSAFCLCCN